MPHLYAGILVFIAQSLTAGIVGAQDYPNKPVRILAGAAGGGSDFDARQIAGAISGPLGQNVIVDNRASALITAETLSKSAPDGYTFMVNGSSSWINPLLQKTPYDTLRDFAPITHIARTVLVVAVHPSVPARNIKELIALARAKPGELNYGAVTVGGPAHLAGELFKSLAQVKIVTVHFKAQAASVTALISGEMQVMFADPNAVLPHAKSGRLRALAITSAEPSAVVTGLPTVASSGLPGYELVGAGGMWAPAKTSAAIITRINQEVVRALGRPEIKERFFNAGLELIPTTPEAFDAMIRADITRMSKVIKDAGIKVD
jgi:tripartite-type tricarboxylate transporter receptor subunit TctC